MRAFLPATAEILENPIPRGLPVSEIDDYLRSASYFRRRTSLVSRRVFILGTSATALLAGNSTAYSQAQVAALIAVGISALDLVKKSLEVYEEIRGKLGLTNGKSTSQQGQALQYVSGGGVILTSRGLEVQVPAGGSITVQFDGPAAPTKQADTFGTRTAVTNRQVSIVVK